MNACLFTAACALAIASLFPAPAGAADPSGTPPHTTAMTTPYPVSNTHAIGWAGALPLGDEQLSELRGAGTGWFQTFINNLPPGNTVVIQIGSSTTTAHDPTAPQSLTITQGGTTATGSASTTTTHTSLSQQR